MQYIVAGHNITVYHTCVLHSVINVLCTLVQKRCYVIDAKDSEIQYFKVHITNSLQEFDCKSIMNLAYMQIKMQIIEKSVMVWIISVNLCVLLFGEGGEDEAVEGGGRLGGAVCGGTEMEGGKRIGK